MTLQTEPGTKQPLRPIFAIYGLASAASAPLDASPVDWTSGATRMTPVLTVRAFDDDDTIGITGSNINLPDGLYEVGIRIHAVNTDASSRDVRYAVTNHGGTTVFHQSNDITILAGEDITYQANVLVTVSGGLGTGGINFRHAATAPSVVNVQPAQIGFIRRIGNNEEVGPA